MTIKRVPYWQNNSFNEQVRASPVDVDATSPSVDTTDSSVDATAIFVDATPTDPNPTLSSADATNISVDTTSLSVDASFTCVDAPSLGAGNCYRDEFDSTNFFSEPGGRRNVRKTIRRRKFAADRANLFDRQ